VAYTIRLAVQAYEKARGLPKTDLGDVGKFMASVTNFVKGCQTISQILFKQPPPEPKAYAAVARSTINSPFFEALRDFSKHEQGAEHFIHGVLGVSLTDAKALSGELAK
jgi:hypothetical protein